jgi:hypothetical protein
MKNRRLIDKKGDRVVNMGSLHPHNFATFELTKFVFIDDIITATHQAYKHTVGCKAAVPSPAELIQHCKGFILLTAQLGLTYCMRPELAHPEFPCFKRLKEDMLFWAKNHYKVFLELNTWKCKHAWFQFPSR